MRQRVMIAMALSCDPKLLIADEPTTALDVTIQAQILELIKRVQDDTGAALILITHDLGVVAETVHDVVVMYGGRVVETGTRGRGPADAQASLHGGAPELHPVARHEGPAPERHQGLGAQPVQYAGRLQLPAALPLSLRTMRRPRPADRGPGRAGCRLLAVEARVGFPTPPRLKEGAVALSDAVLGTTVDDGIVSPIDVLDEA